MGKAALSTALPLVMMRILILLIAKAHGLINNHNARTVLALT